MFLIIGERSRAAARSSDNLCIRCWNYSGKKYALDDREDHFCAAVPNHAQRLRGPVATCSDFSDKTKPSKDKMENMAWIIEASKREVGFGVGVRIIPPSQRNDITRD